MLPRGVLEVEVAWSQGEVEDRGVVFAFGWRWWDSRDYFLQERQCGTFSVGYWNTLELLRSLVSDPGRWEGAQVL